MLPNVENYYYLCEGTKILIEKLCIRIKQIIW